MHAIFEKELVSLAKETARILMFRCSNGLTSFRENNKRDFNSVIIEKIILSEIRVQAFMII